MEFAEIRRPHSRIRRESKHRVFRGHFEIAPVLWKRISERYPVVVSPQYQSQVSMRRRAFLELQRHFIKMIAHLFAFAIKPLPILVHLAPCHFANLQTTAERRGVSKLEPNRGIQQHVPPSKLDRITQIALAVRKLAGVYADLRRSVGRQKRLARGCASVESGQKKNTKTKRVDRTGIFHCGIAIKRLYR